MPSLQKSFILLSSPYSIVKSSTIKLQYSSWIIGAPPWSSGSVLDHRSQPPGFESRSGHIWRVFHLWLHLITFGGRSAHLHLAYHVHKSGRKTSIIIIIQLDYLITAFIHIVNIAHFTGPWSSHIGHQHVPLPWVKFSLKCASTESSSASDYHHHIECPSSSVPKERW